MPRRELDTPERVVITRPAGTPPALAFQHAQVPAPRWPDPKYPQQIHLDIYVNDSCAAQDLALRLGAIRLPDLGGSCPVYADPAGHPFFCALRRNSASTADAADTAVPRQRRCAAMLWQFMAACRP